MPLSTAPAGRSCCPPGAGQTRHDDGSAAAGAGSSGIRRAPRRRHSLGRSCCLPGWGPEDGRRCWAGLGLTAPIRAAACWAGVHSAGSVALCLPGYPQSILAVFCWLACRSTKYGQRERTYQESAYRSGRSPVVTCARTVPARSAKAKKRRAARSRLATRNDVDDFGRADRWPCGGLLQITHRCDLVSPGPLAQQPFLPLCGLEGFLHDMSGCCGQRQKTEEADPHHYNAKRV
jgi:hypothetical protein